jgi:hypothetical protein
MAPEKPTDDQSEQTEDLDTRDLTDERKTEDGATVEEESEQSFPASDPPSY